MKEFFKKINQHNYLSNKSIIEVLINNNDKVSDKSIQLISHIILAQDIWLNRLLAIENQIVLSKKINVHELDELNEKSFIEFLKIIETKSLEEVVNYKSLTCEVFNNSILDILYQIISHGNYHRGQINLELRKSGIDPILIDYILYVR